MNRLAICAVLLAPVGALAQPMVQRDFYEGAVRARGNSVVFCVWPDSPLLALDRAVGTALAEAQLFEAEFYEVPDGTSGTQDVFEQELFIHLMDHCDAAMGTNLNWQPLPEWLTVTEAYYAVPHVLAVGDAGIGSFGELPAGSRVGSLMFSQADMTLANAIAGGGVASTRVPYDTAAHILEAVAEGRLEAGLVPGHAFPAFAREHPQAEIHLASPEPLPLEAEPVGIALLSRDVYLRELLGSAIATLRATGRLDGLAAELGFPVARDQSASPTSR